MLKLYDELEVHFRKKFPLHQINRLGHPEILRGVSPIKSHYSSTSFSFTLNESQPGTSQLSVDSGLQITNASVAILSGLSAFTSGYFMIYT